MARHDRISALFFIGVALAISAGSIRLGPGSLSNPGPGLIPLGCGLTLGILSLIVFAGTFMGSADAKEALWVREANWGNVPLALASMVGYALLINAMGFLIVTFLWMGLVCRGVGRMGWKGTIFTSLVTTVSCYVLFTMVLEIRFPSGIFRF